MNQEKDPMQIINNPDNYKKVADEIADVEEITSSKQEETKGVSRRDVLRWGGLAAAVGTVAASGAAGFATGRSADAYTGTGRTYQGEDMFFNREPFRVDEQEMFKPVGEVTRPNWTDYIFERRIAVGEAMRSKQWNPSMGIDAFPGELGDWYRARPDRYEAMVDQLNTIAQQTKYWKEVAHKRYAIADAYASAHRMSFKNHSGSPFPEDPQDVYKKTGIPQPPEEWDYRNVSKHKWEFKSPAHASKLIKRMAHLFGASFVAITKFDPTFMATNMMRGMPNRGWGNWGDKVPTHWKSMIVFGSPMSWDHIHTSNGYHTGTDGYFKSRNTAGLLEGFIQKLGHPARAQAHGCYEVMMTPFVLKSGLGEYSRAGYVMVPEVGGNFRPAGVITDIEFEYDKPIDIGMAAFCKKCKICAETCPSGSISMEDEPTQVVRGFKRWVLDEETCYKQWCASPIANPNGCGVCLSVCPYTRKNTWIHTISRELEARDGTGLVSTGLLAMQENFFKYPTGEEFRSNWDGGREANYHDPVDWQRSEDFFDDLVKDWEYQGMH